MPKPNPHTTHTNPHIAERSCESFPRFVIPGAKAAVAVGPFDQPNALWVSHVVKISKEVM